MRDSRFHCTREAGFAKIGHGMRDSDKERKWDAGFPMKDRQTDRQTDGRVILLVPCNQKDTLAFDQ